MFVPTIKYKKVNAEKDDTTIVDNSIAPSSLPIPLPCPEKQQQPNNNELPSLSKGTTSDSSTNSQTSNELALSTPISQPDGNTTTVAPVVTFEEKDDATITVDPIDDERILITLSDGKTQYTADRYCPHAGADLSYLGQVDEDEYPPEIGPILLCTLHYWEFALKRAGRGANGVATINACPFADDSSGDSGAVACHAKDKLDW